MFNLKMLNVIVNRRSYFELSILKLTMSAADIELNVSVTLNGILQVVHAGI